MPLELRGVPSLQDDFPEGVSLDSMRVPASCQSCARRRFGTLGCAAFPDKIPLAIARGRHSHRVPFPGDHGLLYKPTGS